MINGEGKPMPPKQGRMERLASSTGGILFARFSMWAVLPLLATLGGFIVSFYNDGKQFDLAQLTAIAAINAQLSVFIATFEGGTRTQAAVDAAQDGRQEFRFARVEADVADIETRTRALEAWQRYVLNRDDPPL